MNVGGVKPQPAFQIMPLTPNLETLCWIAEYDITLQTNTLIGSDEIVSAIHLQRRYHTADEHVYRYSDKRVLRWRRTLLALETNTFTQECWRRTRWKCVFKAQSHTQLATSNFQKELLEPTSENWLFHAAGIQKVHNDILGYIKLVFQGQVCTPEGMSSKPVPDKSVLTLATDPAHARLTVLTLATDPAHAWLRWFYLDSTPVSKVVYQTLSLLVQQWEGLGDGLHLDQVKRSGDRVPLQKICG